MDKAKEVAQEEAVRVKRLTQDAVNSRAYLYPLKGIFYFATHQSLWQPLWSQLAPTITTGIGVTTFMFALTYLPQAAALAIINGPFAVVSAIALVLSESSAITSILARSFFIDAALLDTFDGTLVERNQTELVTAGRTVKPGGSGVSRLGKVIRTPFSRFTPKAIIRNLMYLPLNFIPIVGTAIYIILQGKRSGPAALARYFQLKGMTARQREEHVEKHRGAYTSFGVPAVLLEMVPFVGIFFAFTNTVGAALWAAEMEEKSN
ncbi:hypothetical protein EJ06DRAFT_526181 [Trichodelitschia bisporula]|uniref:Outer spore wall protein RRT8 n=1 Tax=Trichodelitschia bisporula TaxID=703511 RepID=A0A6G1I7B6_9PEZI|nr:hypothetical protein EJ06DRAFT_526181 [Trichodelitschia bisporula]